MSEQANELVAVEQKNIPAIFTEGGCDSIIERLKKEAAKFKGDITTAKGRKEIASFARKFSTSKVYLDGLGKKLSDDYRAKIAPINVERNKIEACCDKLRDEVRKPLTDWEDAEKKRVADIEFRIHTINDFIDVQLALIVTAEDAKEALNKINAIVVDDSFEEFELAATKAKASAVTQLEAKFIVLQNQEKEAAEAARLEEERLETERIEREDKLKKEAAAQATKEAEEKAAAEAEEKDRLAKEELEKANRERLEAELATKKAEDEKREAEKLAKEQAELAVEDEKRRVAEETRQEEIKEKKRQENKKHRGKINREAKLCLTEEGFGEKEAEKIVTIIAQGLIKNITINY